MKKKDLIRIACKNILFAIWIVIINLVMNESVKQKSIKTYKKKTNLKTSLNNLEKIE